MAEVTRASIREFVAFVARSVVEDPDAVEVTEHEKEDYVVIELAVAPADLGRVIGKNGQTARALRTLVNAAASRAGEKIIFEIRE